jgi:hypothetical protein
VHFFTRNSGFKSYILGGEGILMKLKNVEFETMTIHTQNRNLYEFSLAILKYQPKEAKTSFTSFFNFYQKLSEKNNKNEVK